MKVHVHQGRKKKKKKKKSCSCACSFAALQANLCPFLCLHIFLCPAPMPVFVVPRPTCATSRASSLTTWGAIQANPPLCL